MHIESEYAHVAGEEEEASYLNSQVPRSLIGMWLSAPVDPQYVGFTIESGLRNRAHEAYLFSIRQDCSN
jgi:hypothetical protein